MSTDPPRDERDERDERASTRGDESPPENGDGAAAGDAAPTTVDDTAHATADDDAGATGNAGRATADPSDGDPPVRRRSTGGSDGGDNRLPRLLTVAAAGLVAAVVGWLLFVVVPDDLAGVLGVLLVVLTVALGVRFGGRIAASRYPEYNVAEVAVEGPISRDGGPGPLPTGGVGTGSDDVVDLVRTADDDPNAEALLLRLNTPGGEVVPSDDIRRAAVAFDGPTVAYATDTCASGGYWIASGCDELWAHDATVVGSIGVIGSSVNVHELAEELGISYERYAAGKYKDAGLSLKETSEDERAYLQGIVDDLYDDFVERVAEGRGLDPQFVRDTEARVYLGDRALDLGLVDELGSRDDVEARVGELLGREASVAEFEPRRSMLGRLRGGAAAMAYAFGAGVGSAVSPEDGFEFRF